MGWGMVGMIGHRFHSLLDPFLDKRHRARARKRVHPRGEPGSVRLVSAGLLSGKLVYLERRGAERVRRHRQEEENREYEEERRRSRRSRMIENKNKIKSKTLSKN